MHQLAVIWNKNCGDLSKVRGTSGKRLKSAVARWNEQPYRTFWINIIARIRRSQFCTGKNDRCWTADFDFMIRPGSLDKIMEGKYDNKDMPTHAPAPYVHKEEPAIVVDPEKVRSNIAAIKAKLQRKG